MASDLSVFHRVDDLDGIPCSRFFGLAELLPFYDGAVRARVTAMLAGASVSPEGMGAGPAPDAPHPMLAGMIPAGEPVTYSTDAAAAVARTRNTLGVPSGGYRGPDGEAG